MVSYDCLDHSSDYLLPGMGPGGGRRYMTTAKAEWRLPIENLGAMGRLRMTSSRLWSRGPHLGVQMWAGLVRAEGIHHNIYWMRGEWGEWRHKIGNHQPCAVKCGSLFFVWFSGVSSWTGPGVFDLSSNIPPCMKVLRIVYAGRRSFSGWTPSPTPPTLDWIVYVFGAGLLAPERFLNKFVFREWSFSLFVFLSTNLHLRRNEYFGAIFSLGFSSSSVSYFPGPRAQLTCRTQGVPRIEYLGLPSGP